MSKNCLNLFNKELKELCNNYNECYKTCIDIQVKNKDIKNFSNDVTAVKDIFKTKDFALLKNVRLFKPFIYEDVVIWEYLLRLYAISQHFVGNKVNKLQAEFKKLNPNDDLDKTVDNMVSCINEFGGLSVDKEQMAVSVGKVLTQLKGNKELVSKLTKHLDLSNTGGNVDIFKSVQDILNDEENTKLFLKVAEDSGLTSLL